MAVHHQRWKRFDGLKKTGIFYNFLSYSVTWSTQFIWLQKHKKMIFFKKYLIEIIFLNKRHFFLDVCIPLMPYIKLQNNSCRSVQFCLLDTKRMDIIPSLNDIMSLCSWRWTKAAMISYICALRIPALRRPSCLTCSARFTLPQTAVQWTCPPMSCAATWLMWSSTSPASTGKPIPKTS